MPGKPGAGLTRGLMAEWKIFAWCFAVAALLWLFTALEDQYTSSITVNAKYINLPKEKVFVKPLPDDFKVMVTAKGWDLMVNYFRRKAESVTIDLNDYRKTDVLITRQLTDKFALLMSQKISIGDVFPETISLVKDDKGSKKVPVRFVQQLSFKDQFGLGGDISFTPDSVTVTGPVSVIQNIDHVDTEDKMLKGFDKVSNIEVKLKDPEPKNLVYTPNKVDATIPVYQLTEKKISVPVGVINYAVKDTLKLIPEKVSVIYQAPVNKYGSIDSTQFAAIIDGSQIDTTAREPLKIQLITQPRYTYNIRLSPDFVDYVIKK